MKINLSWNPRFILIPRTHIMRTIHYIVKRVLEERIDEYIYIGLRVKTKSIFLRRETNIINWSTLKDEY